MRHYCSLEEVCEGAGRHDFSCDIGQGAIVLAKDLEDGRVGLPLGANLEIVVHSLMSEEHVLVTPVRGNHGRGRDH